ASSSSAPGRHCTTSCGSTRNSHTREAGADTWKVSSIFSPTATSSGKGSTVVVNAAHGTGAVAASRKLAGVRGVQSLPVDDPRRQARRCRAGHAFFLSARPGEARDASRRPEHETETTATDLRTRRGRIDDHESERWERLAA